MIPICEGRYYFDGLIPALRVSSRNSSPVHNCPYLRFALARIIHIFQGWTKASSVTNISIDLFAATKEASGCLKIAQHSVCCSQEFFASLVVAQFDQREGSSDGGALLLKAADRHYGLVEGLSSCLRDERQAGKVDAVPCASWWRQRVFAIACGYPDANDSARLSEDPIHKLLVDRDPIEGRDLASQPTLSRFESGIVGKRTLSRGRVPGGECAPASRQAATPIAPIASPSTWIRPTIPRTAHQRSSFFNRPCDTWCYLPVMGFVSFNDEPEQYLCAAVLRPGNVDRSGGSSCHPAAVGENDSSPYSWSTDSGTLGWRFRASCCA